MRSFRIGVVAGTCVALASCSPSTEEAQKAKPVTMQSGLYAVTGSVFDYDELTTLPVDAKVCLSGDYNYFPSRIVHAGIKGEEDCTASTVSRVGNYVTQSQSCADTSIGSGQLKAVITFDGVAREDGLSGTSHIKFADKGNEPPAMYMRYAKLEAMGRTLTAKRIGECGVG